jgi:hypothetical protein
MKMFGALGGPYLKLKFLSAVYIDNWDYAEKAIVETSARQDIKKIRQHISKVSE